MDGGPTLAGWTDLVRKRIIEMEKYFIGDWSMCPYCLDQFSLPYSADSTRDVICPGCSKVLKRDQILSGELSVDDFVRMPDGKGGWELAISETVKIFGGFDGFSSGGNQRAGGFAGATMDQKQAEKLFNEVYDTEHIPYLSEVPGVLGIARFKTEDLTMMIGGERRRMVAKDEPKSSVRGGRPRR